MPTFHCLHCKSPVVMNDTRTSAAAVMKHYFEQHGEVLERTDPDAVLLRTSAALDEEVDAIINVLDAQKDN